MLDIAERELSHIRVSPEASKAIAVITKSHADIVFHITLGCCDARSPLCLDAGDLRIGARDHLIGMAGSAPVYDMLVTDDVPPPRDYILDVTPGTSVGFSLEAGLGVRFTLREALAPYFWQTAAQTAMGEIEDDDRDGTENIE